VIEAEDIHEERLNRLLDDNLCGIELILQALSLILYNTQSNTDIVELYRLVDLDTFLKIINLFSGRIIQFPTEKQFKNSLLLAILYYYHEIEGKDWVEIKKEFPFEISSISYGIQIKNLNSWIREQLYKLLQKLRKQDNTDDFFIPKKKEK